MEEIIIAAVSALSGLVTVYFAKVRPYFKVLKEAADVFYAIEDAFKDDKLTKEEVRKIYDEGRELIDKVKAIGKK